MLQNKPNTLLCIITNIILNEDIFKERCSAWTSWKEIFDQESSCGNLRNDTTLEKSEHE